MKVKTASRGYGGRHQALRRRFAAIVEAGLASCWRCGLPIVPGEPWDLGHVDGNRSTYGASAVQPGNGGSVAKARVAAVVAARRLHNAGKVVVNQAQADLSAVDCLLSRRVATLISEHVHAAGRSGGGAAVPAAPEPRPRRDAGSRRGAGGCAQMCCPVAATRRGALGLRLTPFRTDSTPPARQSSKSTGSGRRWSGPRAAALGARKTDLVFRRA